MDTGRADADRADSGMAEPQAPETLSLGAEFPTPTRDEWLALVDGVVRRSRRIADDATAGAGVTALTTTTLDGVAVPPLYTAADVTSLPGVGVPGRAPFVRGRMAAGVVPHGWDVRQRHAGTDARAVRDGILADLENGVTSIWLVVGANGIKVSDIPEALDGVLLDLAPVALDAASDADSAASTFLDLATRRGVAPADLVGTLGLDPLGMRAWMGSGPETASVMRFVPRVARRYPRLRAVVVNSLSIHNAGASDAQELGYALSAGVAYLHAMTNAGSTPSVDIDTAARLMEFRLVATAQQFPTIAKMRAARRLWARVLEACGAAPSTTSAQHAVSSPTMFTRRDPYVNLLRGTLAGFAAGVGGADSVTVAPFDALLGASTPFSRRIARNTQTLLVEEAHLARVIDPAGGSWYVESLTDELARAAWRFFQELENEGGAAAVLESGHLGGRISETRSRREQQAATRAMPITGVSEFPDPDEKPVERERLDVFRPHADGALPVFRPAARYEAFRDRSDAVLAKTGRRPQAFLATLGPVAAYTARAGFTRNLLQAGGIEPVEAGPTETADEVVAAFTEADTPVAILCSTDPLYAERGADTAAALRAAGAAMVLLAGKARIEGVDETLAAGGDALATIAAVHAAWEANR